MKNREKYAEEIKNYKGEDFCEEFIRPIILKRAQRAHGCGVGCSRCTMLQMLWLEEECMEEVDWSKVAVDTPILVRDFEYEEWRDRYFARYENETIYVWCDGRTSWSAYDNSDVTSWEYVKLAEREVSDE